MGTSLAATPTLENRFLEPVGTGPSPIPFRAMGYRRAQIVKRSSRHSICCWRLLRFAGCASY